MNRRVLFLGDVHGNTRWFARACQAAVAAGADTIVQAGDFGYWEHEPEGVAYLDDVAELLAHHDLDCVFVDGNHENHTLLRDRYPAGPGGLAEVRPRLRYAHRGARWEWQGVTFLALGGAISVDKEWRVPGVSWWAEEAITDDDVERAIAGGPVDVLVAHDAPVGVDAMGPFTAGDKDNFPGSWANRGRVRQVVDAVRPLLVVHGHYHTRRSSELVLDDGHVVRVEGLDCDDAVNGEAWLAVDLSSLRTEGAEAR